METVVVDGTTYIRTEYFVDFGRAGTAHAVVLDPCVTEESRQRRLECLADKCREILRAGRL